MQRLHTLGARPRTQRLAQLRVMRELLVEPAQGRAQVETGASDKERFTAARANRLDRRPRATPELPRAHGVLGLHLRHEMMRHASAFLGRGRRASDLHAAVDLPRVDADDLGVQRFRERETQRGLPHRGGAEEDGRSSCRG